MHRCLDCGETFAECDFISEPRPYGASTVYEDFACCPRCKSTQIEEYEEEEDEEEDDG